MLMKKRFIFIVPLLCLMLTMVPITASAKETGTQAQKTSAGSGKIKRVEAAKLSKKNKKARKAYQALLEKKKFKRSSTSKFKYALINLDSNGIDELVIDSGGTFSAAQFCQLYTYKNGRVKKLAEIPFVPFAVYTDGTVESFYGHTGYIEQKCYRLKNGSLKKLLEMEGNSNYQYLSQKQKKNAEYGDGWYWYIRKIGGKTSSYEACQKWFEKFGSSHKKLKLKYYANTAGNRKAMLKKR